MKKLVLLALLYLGITGGTFGQYMEWGHVISEDSILAGRVVSVPYDISVDPDNYTYIAGSFYSQQLGTTAATKSTIIKYTEDGRTSWHKNFEYRITTISADDDSGFVYSVAILNAPTQVGPDFYTKPKGANSSVLIKSDSSFNILWTRLISDSSIVSFSDITVTDNEILISGSATNYFRFKGKTYTPGNVIIIPPATHSIGLWLRLEKTKTPGNKEWCAIAYNKFHAYFSGLETDANGDVYGFFHDPANTYYINDIPYTKQTNGQGVIIKFSILDGSVKQVLDIPDILRFNAMTVFPSGKIYLSATMTNKFHYKGISVTKKISNNHISLFMENNGNPIWYMAEDNDTSGGYIHFPFASKRNNNIYIGGVLQAGNSGLGGLRFNKPVNSFGLHYIAAKLDTLGNCLWTLSANEKKPSFTFSLPQRQEVDYNGNPIFTGYFSDSLFLLDTVFFAGQNTNTFIYKIADFSITRGDVYPGPYCAGDTIDIPYKVKGKFNPGNEFIAQLSDEDGSFSGGERELGRLKSNKDGVVKGVLPLFSVTTSGKYRIRILSTSPAAQSYYRQDTLRLLIYSRDSANAGPDTTICYGQKIRLKTTGGSKWEWTPATTLDNPATYRPFASPKTDTEYRIIISDSSGCGDVDTDYVWVRVRQPLKITTPFSDTTICRGQPVELHATTFGGDSLNHRVAWYEQINGMDVFIDSGGKFITTTCGDSCNGQPKKIIAVVTDNCTVEPDTGNFTISVLDALDISITNRHKNNLADTLLCQQQSITLYAQSKGGRAPYTVKWYDSAGAVAAGDSTRLLPALQGIYTAVLTDNCTAKPDTAKMIINLRPLLSVIIDGEDSVCEGKPVTLRATGKGGDTSQHTFKWNNGWWNAAVNPAIHTPLTTGYYKVVLSDNCSPEVTDSFEVTLVPVPVADFDVSPLSGCPPLAVTFTDKSTNHDTALNNWKIYPAEALGVKSHTHPFYSGGNYNFGITVQNAFGCTHDTTKNIRIEVYNKPRASFFIRPEIKEAQEPLLLYNTSQNGNTYTWDFGNGNTLRQYSRNDTTFIYTDSGSYTIGLIAENDKGCRDTASQVIKVFDKIYCAIPTAFTPNSDDVNPVFAPVCNGVAHYSLTIYNRWGEVLYDCENCSWDGTYYGTPVINEVYIYKIQLQGESRKKSTVFGTVHVIR